MAVNIAHGRIEDELVHRLMHQRIIVLGEELEEGNGNRLMHQLLLLSAEDPRSDISLWINSPGGSVSAMLAIHDVMRLVPNDVSTPAQAPEDTDRDLVLPARDAVDYGIVDVVLESQRALVGSGIPRPAGESRSS